MRLRMSSAADCSILPFSTARPSCFSILPMPFWSAASSTSRSTTSYPACALTWAIPCPIRPAPTTPTLLTSISLRPSLFKAWVRPGEACFRAPGAYMPLVDTEDRGTVRHIVMTRSEKRNAMNGELVVALGEAFKDAANDESVRVVVVRGDGPMFSSGMDLGNLHDLAGQAHMLRPFRNECIEAWNRLEEMTKPTIVQIHGAR